MWHLLLELTPASLEVVAYSPYEDQALQYQSLSLPLLPGQGASAALRELIYSHPYLLNDYAGVTVVYSTGRYLVHPDDASESQAAALFSQLFQPSREKCTLLTDTLAKGSSLTFEIPEDTLNFLRRTFNNPVISHPLVPATRWFRGKYPYRNRGKMLVNLRGEETDVIILGEDAPLTVTTFRTPAVLDSLYYIMALRQNHGIPDTAEILVGGNDQLRRVQLCGELRRFVRYVLPALVPSIMFRAGKAALHAPFELILSPLTLTRHTD